MLQFSSARMTELLKDFYTVTGIRIALFGSDFQELLSYPENTLSFCSQIRKDPEVNAACMESDRSGCLRCARQKDLTLYRCHAGLTEAVVPIYDKNGVMGYVFFGQILPAEHCADARKNLKQQFQEDRFPGITAAIEQIPIRSTAELSATGTILQALTSYVMTNRWVTPGKSEFIRRLDLYIEAHLDEHISVEDLCNEFGMGRTHLYSVATDYLGCGLAAYIRTQRLNAAKTLLASTDRPVADIAYATGFSDYNHFSRAFRQAFAQSARDYRNANRKTP